MVDSAASITLEDYPLLWSDTDFISANDSMVDNDRDVEQNSSENQKADLHVEEASRDSIINPTKAVSNCDKSDCRETENDILLSKLLNRASDPEVVKLRKKCRIFEHAGKFDIGSGLLNRGNICYLISVLQLLYHNEQFRRCLLRIDRQSDSAFPIATLFHRMACGATQGAQ
jgi:cell division protein FtsL